MGTTLGNPASDAELAQRVRDGGPDAEAAFAILHSRHHGAALRHARRLEPDAHASEDLVSDAFVEVLAQLRRGGGPRESFRAYLCTTMRNTHADRAQARRSLVLADDAVLDTLAVGPEPQAADALPDMMMVRQAFGSLPDRWQAVLWHTEVEGEKPRHIARLLGMTPNAVSQLAVRAREGLSEAFLKAHIGRLPDRCRTYGERLGGYVRGTLRNRDQRALDDHLADCATCTRLWTELVATNDHLRVLLLPAVLGGAAVTAATTGALAGAGGAGAAAGGAAAGAGAGGAGAGTPGAGAGPGGSAGAGPGGSSPSPGPGDAVGRTARTAIRNALIGSGAVAAVAVTVALALALREGSAPSAAPDKPSEQIAAPAVPPPDPAKPVTVPSPSPTPSRTPPAPTAPTAAQPAPPSTPASVGPSTPPPITFEPGMPPPPPAIGAPEPSTSALAPSSPPPSPTSAAPTTSAPPTTVTQPTPPPTEPVAAMAVDDSATAVAGGRVTLNLLANDRGDALRIVGFPVAWGLYGRIHCDKASGACTYSTWSPFFTGTDVFRYTVRDSQGRYDSATIRITVVGHA